MKEAIEHHKTLRTFANIITDMYGFQPQAEPDAEQALRQALTKHILIQDKQIRKIVREEIGKIESITIDVGSIEEVVHEELARQERLALIQDAIDATEDSKEQEAPIQVGELVAVKSKKGYWWFNAQKVSDGYLLDIDFVEGDARIEKVVRMTKVIEMLNNEV